MDGNYSLADIAAATGNGRNNDGMFGGDGSWWIIVLFIFAFFRQFLLQTQTLL